MTKPEGYPKINPAEVFDQTIRERQDELEYLLDSLRDGLEFISDLDRVNAAISASPRPELTLTQPVEMMPLEHPHDLFNVNNFIPNLRGFGIPVIGDDELWPGRTRFAGRRLPTREELDEYFFMGARGGYDEYMAFAEANGIDEGRAVDILLQTHVDKEAFMRIWILFPELTETIIAKCLDEDRQNTHKSIFEEIFVAYSLMSRLVDVNDRGAVREDGTIDTWLLCH